MLVLVVLNRSSSHESIVLRHISNEDLGHFECFGYKKFSVLCQEAKKMASEMLGKNHVKPQGSQGEDYI